MPYKVGNGRFLLQEQYLLEKDPTKHHFFVPNHLWILALSGLEVNILDIKNLTEELF